MWAAEAPRVLRPVPGDAVDGVYRALIELTVTIESPQSHPEPRMPTRRARPVPALMTGLFLALLSAACGDSATQPGRRQVPTVDAGVSPAADPSSACGSPTVVNLVAGNGRQVVGSVSIANDDNTVFVTFSTRDGWKLEDTHLFVGASAEAIPVNQAGNPVPGRFPYAAAHGAGVTSYTYAIARSTLGSADPVIVAAHADVALGDRQEGAWAGGTDAERIAPRGSWATYVTHPIAMCGAGDDFVTIPCPDLSLAEANALPLDRVAVGRFPDEFDATPYALVTGTGGEAAPAPLIRAEDGTAVLVAPLHPSGDPGGGKVTLRFTDGTRACAAVSFTIDPLPPAPGEFGRVVAALEAIVQRQAGLAGVAPDELLSDPTSLPGYLIPVAVMQSIVADSTNPNSLTTLAGGGLDPETEALLDALLARIGILEMLQDQLAPAPLRSGSVAAPAAIRTESADAVVECTVIGLADVAELDRCMRMAVAAKFQGSGATAKITSDLGDSFAVIGEIPTPPTKLAAKVIGALVWLRQTTLEGMAGILPSQFVSLTFDYKSVFLEDEAGPGEWTRARATATSIGWKMDKAVLNTIFQYVGTAGEGLDAFLDRFPTLQGSAIADFVLNTIIQAFIDSTAGSDFIEVAPKLAGPVDVTDPAWSDQAIVSGNSVELVSHGAYVPRQVGISHLEVRTVDPDDGQFGFQQIRSEPMPIEVTQIELGIAPTDTLAAPEDFIRFKLTVHNAAHPEQVEIDASSPLQGLANIKLGNDTVDTVFYQAPKNPDVSTPDLLTVRDVATTGALAASGVEPTATATIRFGHILVRPRTICLAPGAQQTFTAALVGLPDSTTIAWRTDAGSIPGTGLQVTYTAPTTPPASGVATVVASSANHPTIADTATVQLDCGQIVISPGFTCLAEGAMQTLTASPIGLPDTTSIVWSADVGTIVGSGLSATYTAPSSFPAGSVARITATSADDPGVSGTVTIDLGCRCQFGVQVTGGTPVVGDAGDAALFQDVVLSPTYNGQLYVVELSDAQTGGVLDIQPQSPFVILSPGTYPVGLAGELGRPDGFSDPYYTLEGDENGNEVPPQAWLTVQAYDLGQRLIGSVSGTVVLDPGCYPKTPLDCNGGQDARDRTEAPIQATFEISVPPDYDPGLVGPTFDFKCTVP